jgi:hypothetical protein
MIPLFLFLSTTRPQSSRSSYRHNLALPVETPFVYLRSVRPSICRLLATLETVVITSKVCEPTLLRLAVYVYVYVLSLITSATLAIFRT